jgi:hypothetical protein
MNTYSKKYFYGGDVIFTDLCGLQFWILRLLTLGLSGTLTRLALFNPENTPSVFISIHQSTTLKPSCH